MAISPGNKIPKGSVAGQLQQYTPEQMQLFQNMFGYLNPQGNLGRLASGDQSYFAEMEAPALRDFSALQGNLASRFSGMGMGARKSSGFMNTSNAAASNFAQDLQSRRMDLQRQALNDLFGLSSNLLGQRPYEQFLYQQQTPMWQKLLGGALPIGGMLLGGALGGVPGAQLGSTAGAAAGQAFF